MMMSSSAWSRTGETFDEHCGSEARDEHLIQHYDASSLKLYEFNDLVTCLTAGQDGCTEASVRGSSARFF